MQRDGFLSMSSLLGLGCKRHIIVSSSHPEGREVRCGVETNGVRSFLYSALLVLLSMNRTMEMERGTWS